MKQHTETHVIDIDNNISIAAPDPQVRENYEATVDYIRDLETKMRGYKSETPEPEEEYTTHDFTKWNIEILGSQDPQYFNITTTETKFDIKITYKAAYFDIYDYIDRPIGYTYNFKIKLTGMAQFPSVQVTKGQYTELINMTEDGEYLINTTITEDEAWERKHIMIWIQKDDDFNDGHLIIEQIRN